MGWKGTHTDGMLYHLGKSVPVVAGLPLMVGKASNGTNVKYIWVDVANGLSSGNNLGSSPSRAYSTIAAAVSEVNGDISWSATRWAPLHVIVVMPGVYAENLTSLPYGATIVGLGDSFDINGQNGVTIKPASGAPVDCTSIINCHIHNICFESPDTSACMQADNFNRNILSHCMFTGVPGASPTTVYGLQIIKDMTGNRISDCVFQVVQNGIHITTDNANSKQASGNIIEHCYVRGASATGIFFHANCVPSYTQINHCVIGDATTLALGLDDNTGLVNVSWTTFSATACDPASGDSDSKYNGCYLNGTLMT